MSELAEPTAAPQPKEDPGTLVLRGRPRPAVRYRRGLIVGVAGALAAALVTLSWFALEPPSFRKSAAPIDGGEPVREGGPEALANAPGSYGDVPRLGPPLPGDLGRPILEEQRGMGAVQAGGVGAPGGDPVRSAAEAERARVVAARQAARSSAVLVQLEDARPAASSGEVQGSPPGDAAVTGQISASPPLTASQQRKLDFTHSSAGDQNPHELRAPPSPWTLSAGAIIPASLITGLNSDLPGLVVAQVSANVRDSATGRTILIPQGARLIGSYDSLVAHGQRRALLVWTRIVFPDGASINLDNMPGADVAGYAGLEDAVDSHSWQLLKGIGLSTLLGVGTELSLSGEGDLVRAIRQSAQQNGANAGDRITGQNLDVQPTILVRPGWPVRVIVNKDLVLKPWSA